MKIDHKETYKYIKSISDKKYEVGIILGTGLGGLVKYIEKNIQLIIKTFRDFRFLL